MSDSINQSITEVEYQLDCAYKREPINRGEIEELEHQLDYLHNQLDQSTLTIYK